MSLQNRIALNPKYSKVVGGHYSHWPVLIWPPNKDVDEYKVWCKEHIGTNGWNYYGQYRKIPFEFRFKRSEDLLAFRLTFGFHHNDTVYV